jgi:hypothetical protein
MFVSRCIFSDNTRDLFLSGTGNSIFAFEISNCVFSDSLPLDGQYTLIPPNFFNTFTSFHLLFHFNTYYCPRAFIPPTDGFSASGSFTRGYHYSRWGY